MSRPFRSLRREAELAQTAPRRKGFKPIPAGRRLAFLVLVCAALYLIFDVYMLRTRGLFLFIGVDYRATWASAVIAHTYGFARVYDIDLQRQIQEGLVYAFAAPDRELKWSPLPVPYLPAFVATYVPFLLFPPGVGFVAWTILNVATIWGYMIWFWRQVQDEPGRSSHGRAALFALCLSFPALESFQFSQAGAWLLIFMGEFFRLQIRGASFPSGLWLAGFLLKPQTLLVIVPGLLLARRWRTLAGAAAGSIGLLAISLALGGLDSLIAEARLVFLFSEGIPGSVPKDMMNWRSFALHLSDALPPEVVWPIAIGGMVVTYVVGLSLWLGRDRWPVPPVRFALIILGSYAATCAVAWHSHTHMGIPMAIPLLYLAAWEAISYRTLAVWLVGPYLVFAILRVVFDLGHMGVLFVNLYLLGWAALKIRQEAWAPRPAAEPVAIS